MIMGCDCAYSPVIPVFFLPEYTCVREYDLEPISIGSTEFASENIDDINDRLSD